MSELPDALIDDETSMTELTIDPDGRVFVFGASRGVLEVLETLDPHDQRIATLLTHVRAAPHPEQHVIPREARDLHLQTSVPMEIPRFARHDGWCECL